MPVWVKSNGKVKINAILDDALNETFLNVIWLGCWGCKSQPYEKVKVHVLNDSVETFNSMPITVTIETVDGQFSNEMRVRTCPRKTTENYRVKGWSEHQKEWPQFRECSIPKQAKDGFVDMLIGVDNADLHYSIMQFTQSKRACSSPRASGLDVYWKRER